MTIYLLGRPSHTAFGICSTDLTWFRWRDIWLERRVNRMEGPHSEVKSGTNTAALLLLFPFLDHAWGAARSSLASRSLLRWFRTFNTSSLVVPLSIAQCSCAPPHPHQHLLFWCALIRAGVPSDLQACTMSGRKDAAINIDVSLSVYLCTECWL